MIKKLIPVSFKDKLNAFRMRGQNVECNICNRKYVSFMPSGDPLRANAICPSCGSVERTRIYWEYLKGLSGFLTSNIRVLHSAPEPSLFKKFSSIGNFDYHPIDLFQPGYSYPKATRHMDIQDLDYPDNHFDFILSSHVLEHVEDDAKAMKEFYRVLSPGGFGIIMVPIDLSLEETHDDPTNVKPEDRIKAYGQYDHLRMYGRDYQSKLEKAGFKVEANDFSIDLEAADKFRLGFGNGETLFIVRK